MKMVSLVIRDDVKGESGSAVVELSGEEIIYLSNILYRETKQMLGRTAQLELAKSIKLLNEIVQHGCVDSYAVGMLAEINERLEKRVK